MTTANSPFAPAYSALIPLIGTGAAFVTLMSLALALGSAASMMS